MRKLDADLEQAQRVLAGALFLDMVAPGWDAKVDPETLNLRSITRCVLGQVFAEQGTWITEACDCGCGRTFINGSSGFDWAVSTFRLQGEPGILRSLGFAESGPWNSGDVTVETWRLLLS